MRIVKIPSKCLLTLAMTAPFFLVHSAAAVVTFDWATVRDPGNLADTLVMTKGPNADNTTGYGAVGYEYQIAKTHVTNSQYTEFLNAVDPNGEVAEAALNPPFPQPKVLNGIYNPNMSLSEIDTTGIAYTGGIDYSSTGSAGSKYLVKSGQENYPATWINWDSGARFVNWLHNGQGSGDMENGVYDMSIVTGAPPPRHEDATVFIPSEDEFYKAAYYDPTKSDPTKNENGGYWQYGVQSDSPPTSEGPSGSAISANYATAAGAAGSSGDLYWQNNSTFDDSFDHLTDVGAYTNATSYYGLYDVDGLIYQYTEGIQESQFGDFPAYRGGSWYSSSEFSGAAYRNLYSFRGAVAYAWFGLRLASPFAAAPGDFDQDGDVDGADFLQWQRSDGTPSGLTEWKNGYGGGSLAAITSVPEPSSIALLLTLAVVGVCSRCRIGSAAAAQEHANPR